MNKKDQLMRNISRAFDIDSGLWSFSVIEQGKVWEKDVSKMTEEEMDTWLSWDERWLTDKSFRDGYESMKALRDL